MNQETKKVYEFVSVLQDRAVEAHNALQGVIEDLEEYKVELEKIISDLNKDTN